MTNKEIKQLISTIESTLVSKQNQIARDQYNLKYKNSIIETQAIKINSLEQQIYDLDKEYNEANYQYNRVNEELNKKDEQIKNLLKLVDNLENKLK